ncbi:MAG: crossover junction endodeoxyribonuclease RuvC [Bacteroidetes bacterium]|nr:crossover junction endodeoxyribonuclease RuvC [Bacteroidota bacterium]
MKNSKECIILGIDPGTVAMGYGIISVKGNQIQLISAGVLHLNKKDDHFIRLKEIFETVSQLIDTHHPDEFAIEEPFFGKNVQSMLKLGRAQGMAIAAALSRKLPVFGYSPRLIKQSITGKGSSSKEQVSIMLQRILKFEEQPKLLDATDALGVALCHHFQTGKKMIVSDSSIKNSSPVKKGKGNYSGWDAFVSDNPERTK